MTTRAYHRPRTELSPDAKARLRKAYLDDTISVEDIGRRFGMAARTIGEIVRREGWPMRKTREERVAKLVEKFQRENPQ